MKISVYTILYYDTQFLETIYNHIEKYIDEFIIVDGPYSYAIETLKKYNLFYDENSRPAELLSLIEKFPKIKYHQQLNITIKSFKKRKKKGCTDIIIVKMIMFYWLIQMNLLTLI